MQTDMSDVLVTLPVQFPQQKRPVRPVATADGNTQIMDASEL